MELVRRVSLPTACLILGLSPGAMADTITNATVDNGCHDGVLYGATFYGELSFTMCRTDDLFDDEW